MNAQDTILHACKHEHTPCHVKMPNGTTLDVCCDCWNASVYARRAERREARNKARRERNQAMRDLGLKRVRGALGGTYWE